MTTATSTKKEKFGSIVSVKPKMKSHKWFIKIPPAPAIFKKALIAPSQLHFVHPEMGGHQRTSLVLGALGGRILTPKALMEEKSLTKMKEFLEVFSLENLTCMLIILMKSIMEIFLLLYLISFPTVQI